MAELPLILAGPILRRVEPSLVSVWLALSEACTVRIQLHEGRKKAGDPPKLNRATDDVKSIQIGEKLHLAMALMKLVPADELKPGQVYSYNVTLVRGAKSDDLKSLKLLKDAPGVAALGYQEDLLPSFALPPAKIEELRILHGSCRKLVHNLEEGLAWGDGPVKDFADEPNKRVHQMLLSGDQIYADDVAMLVLPQLVSAGQTLLGANRERLPIQGVDGKTVRFAVADKFNFPPGMRHNLITSEARYTTTDRDSHLMSFGEFAAMYLFAWSNVLWDPAPLQDDAKGFDTFFEQFRQASPETLLAIFRQRDEKNQPDIDDALLARFAKLFLKDLSPDDARKALKRKDELVKDDAGPTKVEDLVAKFQPALNAAEQEKFKAFVERMREDLGGQFPRMLDRRPREARTALKNLHIVRRLLANVPTYMIWDDHEITDDWNLNPMWRDRAMTSPLGRAIVRNGMLAYALFQGWGNDPEKFTKGKHKRLLELASQLYSSASTTAAAQQILHDEIEALLGLNRRTLDPAKPEDQLDWHYQVTGPAHHIAVLDNRTQRNWLSRGGPPTNLMLPVIEKQVPAGPLPGKEVLIVVAPLPVLGPPMFDELVAPLAYRAYDALSDKKKLRGMPGTNPDAIEAWSFDPAATEALFKRLAPHRKVVLLSGDVHYGSGQVMSYWRKSDPETNPCRFVQFTSSGIKNVMPEFLRKVDAQFSRAQRLIRMGLRAERLGWDQPGELLTIPDANKAPGVLREKLKAAPVLIPTFGWPEKTKVKATPDWCWRIAVLRDERPDDLRPEIARTIPLPDDAPDHFEPGAYRLVANRHADQFKKMKNGRQITFGNNIGLLRFEKQGTILSAVQELLSIFPYEVSLRKESDPPLLPEIFAVHRAALTVADEKKPTIGATS